MTTRRMLPTSWALLLHEARVRNRARAKAQGDPRPYDWQVDGV